MRVKSVEIWRILFTVSIVLCHACVLPWKLGLDGTQKLYVSTYAVEFFFVLSGFLMAKSACTPPKDASAKNVLGEETFSFVVRKMKPIFPVYLFAAIFELAVHLLLRTGEPKEIYFRIWDFLFLRAAGLGDGNMSAVGGGWYLSAMFLAMWIIYPLLRKFTNVFLYVIAPLTAIFLFGWFESVYGHINFALYMENGICLGLLRAIAVMCAGIFGYGLCEKLKKHMQSSKASVLITLAELLSMAGAFAFVLFVKRSRTDFIVILLLCVGIIAAFSGNSYTNVWLQKLDKKWTAWIPEFSLCLYLNHYVWVNTLQDWKLAVSYWTELTIYLLLTLLSALTCFITLRTFRKLRSEKKIKKERASAQ